MPDPDAVVGELSDADLVASAAGGDRDAFDAIVRRHQARVFRLARAFTDSQADAEDVLQQAFLSAWQAAATFRGDATVSTWLLTIARNAAWHGRERQARMPIDDTPVDELGVEAGWGSNPEVLAVRAEEAARLEAAFSRLTPDDRQVLTLRDVDGMSGAETAVVLGLAIPAMKSRLHRARLRLVIELRKEDPDDRRRS